MDYIQITKENIDKEHICCAMSGKQSLAKKEWLKQRFAEGLVFYRSVERGKCFIEYIPAENAWVPITADSETSELIGMSDRIMVMCDGRCTGFIDGDKANQENIMTLATQFE